MPGNTPKSSKSQAGRFFLLALGLISVVGLSGSSLPQSHINLGSSQYHAGAVTGMVPVEGTSEVAPQVSFITAASNTVPISQVNSYNPQQLTTWQDAEGILYEDYRSRRSRVIICIEIAKRLSAEPLSLTEIALHARINFSHARFCLEQMISAGLVQSDPWTREKKYTLTRRGLLFLESGERTARLLQPESNEILPPSESENLQGSQR